MFDIDPEFIPAYYYDDKGLLVVLAEYVTEGVIRKNG
jgi:hypothetical protein